MKRTPALFLVLALASSGCATIFNGQTQMIRVETIPDACRVSLDGASAQTAPCSFPVKRGQEHILRIEKDGYRPTTMTLSKSFSSVTLLNCLLPGWIIWYAVDFVDGAAWEMDHTMVSAVLEPAPAVAPAAAPAAAPLAVPVSAPPPAP